MNLALREACTMYVKAYHWDTFRLAFSPHRYILRAGREPLFWAPGRAARQHGHRKRTS